MEQARSDIMRVSHTSLGGILVVVLCFCSCSNSTSQAEQNPPDVTEDTTELSATTDTTLQSTDSAILPDVLKDATPQ